MLPPLTSEFVGMGAMLPPVSLTSWMTMLRVAALASAMWRLAIVHPRSALWWMLWDTQRLQQRGACASFQANSLLKPHCE